MELWLEATTGKRYCITNRKSSCYLDEVSNYATAPPVHQLLLKQLGEWPLPGSSVERETDDWGSGAGMDVRQCVCQLMYPVLKGTGRKQVMFVDSFKWIDSNV